MTGETKKLITSWLERACNCKDSYIKFIIYYMCLDAWLSEKTGSSSDRRKNNWLILNMENQWLEDNFIQLERLSTLKPVKDMSPDNGEDIFCKINDINNKEEVINYIYQIRCNLFHGSKEAGIPRNDELIEYSYPILENWVQKILGGDL